MVIFFAAVLVLDLSYPHKMVIKINMLTQKFNTHRHSGILTVITAWGKPESRRYDNWIPAHSARRLKTMPE